MKFEQSFFSVEKAPATETSPAIRHDFFSCGEGWKWLASEQRPGGYKNVLIASDGSIDWRIATKDERGPREIIEALDAEHGLPEGTELVGIQQLEDCTVGLLYHARWPKTAPGKAYRFIGKRAAIWFSAPGGSESEPRLPVEQVEPNGLIAVGLKGDSE